MPNKDGGPKRKSSSKIFLVLLFVALLIFVFDITVGTSPLSSSTSVERSESGFNSSISAKYTESDYQDLVQKVSAYVVRSVLAEYSQLSVRDRERQMQREEQIWSIAYLQGLDDAPSSVSFQYISTIENLRDQVVLNQTIIQMCLQVVGWSDSEKLNCVQNALDFQGGQKLSQLTRSD